MEDISHAIHKYLGDRSIIDPTIKSKKMIRKQIKEQLTVINTPLPTRIHKMIDKMLLSERKVLHFKGSPNKMYTMRGDITELDVECIVNPANSQGLGCFQIDHKCLDNIIHAKAGPRLREHCQFTLKGNRINTSECIITKGYNLPCKFVIHTVGPINTGQLSFPSLANCYTNCLNLANKLDIKSIAFPCISTGVFGYPQLPSAQTAVKAVQKWIKKNPDQMAVIFVTHTALDDQIYKHLLNVNSFQNSKK